jgi:hypothetical protein
MTLQYGSLAAAFASAPALVPGPLFGRTNRSLCVPACHSERRAIFPLRSILLSEESLF